MTTEAVWDSRLTSKVLTPRETEKKKKKRTFVSNDQNRRVKVKQEFESSTNVYKPRIPSSFFRTRSTAPEQPPQLIDTLNLYLWSDMVLINIDSTVYPDLGERKRKKKKGRKKVIWTAGTGLLLAAGL